MLVITNSCQSIINKPPNKSMDKDKQREGEKVTTSEKEDNNMWLLVRMRETKLTNNNNNNN